MKTITFLAVAFVLTMVGIADAAWVQRAAFYPDRQASHTWETTTVTLAGCDSNSVILQKAKSPGTVVQLLYNPSTNATCQASIDKYLDQMILRNPDGSGTVTFLH